MQPGVTYTARDGSTVTMQLLIIEGREVWFNKVAMMRSPDRVEDVRFVETSPTGVQVITRFRSKGTFAPDALYVMESKPPHEILTPPNGIINNWTNW